jgi:hypothetical protein
MRGGLQMRKVPAVRHVDDEAFDDWYGLVLKLPSKERTFEKVGARIRAFQSACFTVPERHLAL